MGSRVDFVESVAARVSTDPEPPNLAGHLMCKPRHCSSEAQRVESAADRMSADLELSNLSGYLFTCCINLDVAVSRWNVKN